MGSIVNDYHRPVSLFNPAWCLRPPPTSKDIMRRWEDSLPSSISSSSYSCSSSHLKRIQVGRNSGAAPEPLSPRIGCMGQIKRDKAAGGGSPPGPVRIKLLNLRRIFSGRNVQGMILAAVSPRARAKVKDDCSDPLGIAARLDPPLPVVKRVVARDSDSVNLWKRRCGEVLEGLQLQQQQQQ